MAHPAKVEQENRREYCHLIGKWDREQHVEPCRFDMLRTQPPTPEERVRRYPDQNKGAVDACLVARKVRAATDRSCGRTARHLDGFAQERWWVGDRPHVVQSGAVWNWQAV